VKFADGEGDEHEIPFPGNPKERQVKFLCVPFFVNGHCGFFRG
jgi:hypothetical protein